MTARHVTDDADAAVRHLSGERNEPVLTLGFCFGGGHSWRLATAGIRLAGAIGFYGRPALVQEAISTSGQVSPVLMLIAGADRATPVEDSLALADELRAAGADVTAHVFEGAPHSFFDRSFAEHAEDCDEAWRLILDFVDRHATATH